MKIIGITNPFSSYLIGTEFERGWGNGYALLPYEHKYYGIRYDDIPVEVHGGLTYGQEVTEKIVSTFKDLKDEHLGLWMIGFDTAHYTDNSENWPKEAVEAEVVSLIAQLKKL